MKIKMGDLGFWGAMALLFLPFLCSETLFHAFETLTREHAFAMGFLKFGILATMGEMLGLRIRKGVYYERGFGLIPRALVWGVLGVGITAAMMLFKKGAPAVCDYLFGFDQHLVLAMQVPGFSSLKLLGAFFISLCMNGIFAPIFMTAHKVTDTHIERHGGRFKGFFTRIDVSNILQGLNWQVQWRFVILKTIPFFWIPAHTLTFMLPDTLQVLFAAILGVVLGVILSIAANKK